MGTVVTGAVVVVIVGLIIRSMVRDKKNGKSLQCGGDCGKCGGQLYDECKKVIVIDHHRRAAQMQKEIVIQRLREQGCRITKQRLMLLDVILNEDCSCCKEIYYRAAEVDPGIGAATVYRMVNLLEEIGAISRKNMYRIACGAVCDREKACTIELDDDTIKELSAKSWNAVVLAGLKACGYIDKQRIKSVVVQSCDCEEAG